MIVLPLFSALFVQMAKPVARLKTVNDMNERIMHRDMFIAESFCQLCGKKANVCESDFSQWLGLCRAECGLSSICVKKIGVKDARALWKVEWDGKEAYALNENKR